jgi:hypothetical protein
MVFVPVRLQCTSAVVGEQPTCLTAGVYSTLSSPAPSTGWTGTLSQPATSGTGAVTGYQGSTRPSRLQLPPGFFNEYGTDPDPDQGF